MAQHANPSEVEVLPSEMSPGDVVGDTSRSPTVSVCDVRRPLDVDTRALDDGTEEQEDLSGMDTGGHRIRPSSPSHREHRSSSPSARRSRTESPDRNVERTANRLEWGKNARRLLGAIIFFGFVGLMLLVSYFDVSRWSAVVNNNDSNNDKHSPSMLLTVSTIPTNAEAVVASKGDDDSSPRWISSLTSIFSGGKTAVVANSAIEDASLGDVAAEKDAVHSTGGGADKTLTENQDVASNSSVNGKNAGMAVGGGGAGVSSGCAARKRTFLRNVRGGTMQWFKKARHAVGSWRARHKEDGEAFLSGDE